MKRVSAVGPLGAVAKVRSHPPFALSLSKGQAELVEAVVSREKASTSSARTVMGQPFDKLRANGPLQTVKFRSGPTADSDKRACLISVQC